VDDEQDCRSALLSPSFSALKSSRPEQQHPYLHMQVVNALKLGDFSRDQGGAEISLRIQTF
jgi:hypothetical protein